MSAAGHTTLIGPSLFRGIAFTAELGDHRLDVSEGPISRLFPLLGLLNLANLSGNMLSSVLSHFLHVFFDEHDLGV